MNRILEDVKILRGILNKEVSKQEALLCLASDEPTIVTCAKDILRNEEGQPPWIKERWDGPLKLIEYFQSDIQKRRVP
jgi:hypothetical protein